MLPPSIHQAFQLAVEHHQAGRLPQAEQLYRQVLAQQPQHADALHMLGVIALQLGRSDVAIDLIRRAITANPNFPDAYCNLGISLKNCGQLDDAIAAYRQAIALNPNFAEAHNNLGNALKDKDQPDEAIAAYRQAIALRPNYHEAYTNLGVALAAKGRPEEAITALRQAITVNPGLAEAYYNLGNTLSDSDRLAEAIDAFRQAITLKPQLAQARYNLGKALFNHGRLAEAIAAYRQVIALNPNDFEAYNNLGIVLKNQGNLDQAITAFRTALALNSNFPDAHYNLGITLSDQGRMDEAIAAFRKAIGLKPNYPEAHNNLGNVLKDQGNLDQAIAAFRHAIALKPEYPEAHSNLVYTLLYHPAYDAPALYQEHLRWNTQHAQPLKHLIKPHPNDRHPDRQLKIGYVGSDFRNHAESFCLAPLFQAHDRAQVDIHCYSFVKNPDAMTELFKKSADHWHDVLRLTDERLADHIRRDQIDILVNLTMHMANSRLLTFARKPAPLQISWLAYPGTTGLAAIDYRLTDPHLDPPNNATDSHYSEKSLRLPHTFWCYDPLLNDSEPSITPLPALTNKHLTFGCLNNFCKINPTVLALWNRLLTALPTARLLILSQPGAHRQKLLDTLAIDPSRIEFIPYQPRLKYLQTFHRIDIALDTFPYNGHTTSLDSLYMGVPIITLVGPTIVGRAGLSQLTNLNLPELIAHTPDQYLQIATTLANNLPRLTHLRATLRDRMQSSPLMNAQLFARNIESAYRDMWRTFCNSSTR